MAGANINSLLIHLHGKPCLRCKKLSLCFVALLGSTVWMVLIYRWALEGLYVTFCSKESVFVSTCPRDHSWALGGGLSSSPRQNEAPSGRWWQRSRSGTARSGCSGLGWSGTWGVPTSSPDSGDPSTPLSGRRCSGSGATGRAASGTDSGSRRWPGSWKTSRRRTCAQTRVAGEGVSALGS